ncbi:ubiquitin C-terminal hydrolase 12-like isoform X2 [Nicotiana tabacum]|uniref:Ubiquitin C-terminal hydrolase 12-like isoform X2 n=1 Tax=Nicotiana tabacum TaxID=4097 RepID=A0AC58SG21_TOBAC
MTLLTPHPMTLKKEQEEKEQKRKEKVEDRLYTIIKVARDEDLAEQIGKEMYFDLVDHDKVHAFHIQKQMPFTQFKDVVAKVFRIPVQFQRYWLWAKRQNHTYRPDRALTVQEEVQSVGQLREGNTAELKLFLEVELCLDLRPFPPPEKTKEDILLFFKFYDPLKEKIRYVGRLLVKESGKPLEILTKINELVGFSPDEKIELFEEIKFEPNVICEHIDSKRSFRDCEIGDGDIICFQKSLQNQCSEQYRFPEVPSFFEYMHNFQIKLNKEQEEPEQKKKEKAHLYKIIKVARDEDLGEQIGKEIYFDLVDHDKVHSFRIRKQMPFTLFKEEVAKEFGIPVQFQRYWLWTKRQNHSYRPNRPLTAQEEIQSVDQLREVSDKQDCAELKLFLEVDLCLDLRPFAPPGTTKEEILLFFKLYDPLKEKIRYVGRLFVKESGTPLEILTKLNELAGFSPDEEIELFEEIKFEPNVMCEHIDSNLSFRDSQLGDGDIICFQKSLRNQDSDQYRFPEVPLFLEYVYDLQVIKDRFPRIQSLETYFQGRK